MRRDYFKYFNGAFLKFYARAFFSKTNDKDYHERLNSSRKVYSFSKIPQIAISNSQPGYLKTYEKEQKNCAGL